LNVLVAALFGLVIGSFLNVVIHRVPLKESIVFPPSHCPSCGASIRVYDNVPVLSYLLLRGRCRNCKQRISASYPIVEASTAVLFGAAVYAFGLSFRLAIALVLIVVLVSLAGSDYEHRLLPNKIIAPATVVGFVLSAFYRPDWWWVYPVASLIVFSLLFFLAILYPGGMGMGDVKMGGMLGAFLGPYAALAIFLGALVGSIAGGILIATGRMPRRTALPFGVFMAFGGLVTLFVGPEVWGLYLDLVGAG
jgi:leader peptidase (prepilin peptidase)/N-methyltransferase